MAEAPKYYITTAISYPNGAPHIGHAYEALATDVIARFKRLDGYEVFFLTGTDEHGQKMQQTAERNGQSAAAFADQQAPLFREMVADLGCSNDDFIRTTEPRHIAASQEIWRRMAANGDIYKDKYAGWYSVRDEAYYAESETRLNGDGVRIGPQGSPVEWVEEESYFFRLSAYADRLIALYEKDPRFIGPDERRNEVMSFVKSGLKDLSISRTTFDWGVPVPDDERHVMYVWVDALTNYLTGVGFPDAESSCYQRFWPADLHIIGKDIVRFHSVYWPAFLMSAGIPLPKRVFGHGFLFNKGEKMSKSVGNVIDPKNLIGHYGLDAVRYFFLREVPFGRDGNYSHEAIVGRINADLANDLGNLAQRSLSMIAKNVDGTMPNRAALEPQDKALLDAALALADTCRAHMDNLAIHLVLTDIWAVIADANRYFAGQEPWALKKTDPERMQTVLSVTAEVLRLVGLMIQPVMPASAARLLDGLAVPAESRTFAGMTLDDSVPAGTALPAPSPIFPRYVEDDATDGKS